MLTGLRYLSLFARPTWFLDRDDGGGGGDGGGSGDDSGDDDDADEDDEEADDDTADGEDLETLKADRDKWKAQSRKHETRAKANAKAAKELEAERLKNLPADEAKVKEAEERGRTAARVEHAQQLAGAKIEAALAGIVDDPAEFVEDLNLAKFVTDEGDVDVDAIDALKKKWAARKGTNEDADDDDSDGGKPPAKKKADLKQGARGKHNKSQLTRDELKNMTPEQIDQAHREGRLNEMQGIR